jgi:hypothetical protein
MYQPLHCRKKQVSQFRLLKKNNHPLDNMLRVVTAVQQIMTEFNGAVSQEDNIMVVTKIVLNFMNQTGH